MRKKETAQISRIWISHFTVRACTVRLAATFRYVRSDGLSGFPDVFTDMHYS